MNGSMRIECCCREAGQQQQNHRRLFALGARSTQMDASSLRHTMRDSIKRAPMEFPGKLWRPSNMPGALDCAERVLNATASGLSARAAASRVDAGRIQTIPAAAASQCPFTQRRAFRLVRRCRATAEMRFVPPARPAGPFALGSNRLSTSSLALANSRFALSKTRSNAFRSQSPGSITDSLKAPFPSQRDAIERNSFTTYMFNPNVRGEDLVFQVLQSDKKTNRKLPLHLLSNTLQGFNEVPH